MEMSKGLSNENFAKALHSAKSIITGKWACLAYEKFSKYFGVGKLTLKCLANIKLSLRNWKADPPGSCILAVHSGKQVDSPIRFLVDFDLEGGKPRDWVGRNAKLINRFDRLKADEKPTARMLQELHLLARELGYRGVEWIDEI